MNIEKAGSIPQPSFLKASLLTKMTLSRNLLFAIVVLSFGLHLYNLRSIGDSNAYYTAAVRSMLQSWHNFFFVAAEPGGSVTVDKPPLGFWIEAISAYFLGVSGFSTSLPNILAGVLEIPVLYHLVKKYMGELAGLIAALVMALTPIFIATNRNNTVDAMLSLTLLLATWAFIRATETGKLRWALLGALLIGIGFNIKMSEALLPVPALYALYFLGSKEGWLRKAFNLCSATVLLVAVSLSWALMVDRTPADQRPYIGSSSTNSVMELILNQNGANRLFETTAAERNAAQNGQASGQKQPPLPKFNGTVITYQQETGKPGVFRFFIPPLSKQMSWLLPFALFNILLALFGSRLKLPVESPIHKALILWGGWLITCLVFFSIISGIFHAYYVIVSVPALGAMVGVGFAQLWNLGSDKKWAGVLLILAAIGTLAFQRFAIYQYKDRTFLIIISGILLATGSLLMIVRRQVAYLTILSAILIVPAYWTLMTAASNVDQTFPSAYIGGSHVLASSSEQNNPNLRANQRIIAYLQSNTRDVKYLVAVPSAMQGAPLVLTSERPVLFLGGFSGLDAVINVNDLKRLVENGDLRYILYAKYFRRPGGVSMGDQEILNWLDSSCLVVPKFSSVIVYSRRPRPINQSGVLPVTGLPRNDFLTLYLCP
jgi:4-amino-4-deoxy-L-arabinose transferase-like glycosyltransferase